MGGKVRRLVFAEGISVVGPTQNRISATLFDSFVNDAEYVAAKGSAAEEGDIYANTTLHVIRYFDGTRWTNVNNKLNNFDASVDPNSNDDETQGYSAGSQWLNGELLFICVDASSGAAVWNQIGSAFIGQKESAAGLINGINTDFNITMLPVDGTIIVLRNGLIVPNDQYSFVHPTISFVTPPSLGTKLESFYLTEGQAATAQLVGSNRVVETRTILIGEVTAKEITLIATPIVATQVIVDVIGGSSQAYGLDFVVSGDVLSWNGLGLDGVISAGTILRIDYFE